MEIIIYVACPHTPDQEFVAVPKGKEIPAFFLECGPWQKFKCVDLEPAHCKIGLVSAEKAHADLVEMGYALLEMSF